LRSVLPAVVFEPASGAAQDADALEAFQAKLDELPAASNREQVSLW
jgi:hypothetical protein